MTMAVIPIIVTRPDGQAGGLIAELSALGLPVRHHPLIDIVPLADDEQALASGLRQRILDIDHYTAVIAISINAAAIGLDWLDRYWPQPPLGIHWCAVGPSTAEVLQQQGFTVHSPVTTYDSEGLLALPVMQSNVIGGHKVLLWRGVGGREKLAAVLSERGAQVDYAELYERREIAWGAEQWAETLAGEPLLLLSSNQALDIVEQQVPDLPQRVRAIMLPGERVAAVARSRGYREVLVAASARDEDMLACLREWQAPGGQ